MVLAAADDRLLPSADEAARLAKTLPRAFARVLPGASHAVLVRLCSGVFGYNDGYSTLTLACVVCSYVIGAHADVSQVTISEAPGAPMHVLRKLQTSSFPHNFWTLGTCCTASVTSQGERGVDLLALMREDGFWARRRVFTSPVAPGARCANSFGTAEPLELPSPQEACARAARAITTTRSHFR